MDNKTVSSRTTSDVERFDRWAATYDQSIMQRLYFGPVHSKMLDFLAREGPQAPPSCIIDVGCGTGRLLRAASIRWPEAQLFGVDPAAQMVSEASRLNPNVDFRLASAEALPFPDQTADIYGVKRRLPDALGGGPDAAGPGFVPRPTPAGAWHRGARGDDLRWATRS